MRKKYILSKDVKPGQIVLLGLLLCIFITLIFLSIAFLNYNYLLIAVGGIICFLPIYLWSLSFFTIEINGNYFVISNLLKRKTFPKEDFEKVIPSETVLATFNKPYFTIIFKTGDKFDFSAKITSGIFSNKKKFADQITTDIRLKSHSSPEQ